MASVFLACLNNDTEKFVIEHFDYGSSSQVIWTKNGITYYDSIFDSDGRLNISTEYIESEDRYVFRAYYQSGIVSTETHYNSDMKKHGNELRFDEGGSLVDSRKYINGKLQQE